MTNPPTDEARFSSARLLVFAALVFSLIVIVVGYLYQRQGRPTAGVKNAPQAPVASSLGVLGGKPGVLFSSAAFDDTNGYLMIQPLGAPDDSRRRTELRCERVHFAGGTGVCVTAERGVATRYSVRVFGPDFSVRHTVPLTGVPSRARVSPDGRRAAVTVFVSGDSYNSGSFSTRTTLFDMATGTVLADLEAFAVTRDGVRFKAVDFNYWGVTFARDGNRFLATLRTAGVNYLIEGDVDRRTARVLRPGVECPALSPDNTRIVYKSRVGASQWRLHMLDLATMHDVELAEVRSVDDQAEWIDNGAIAYALPRQPKETAASSIWTLDVSDPKAPRILAAAAHSPAVVR